MMSPSNRSFPFRRRPAFTLLELLISLAIVSGLTVALFNDLQLGFRARTSGEAAVEPARTAEGAMDFLRLDLESALPPNAGAADTTGISGQTTSTSTTGIFQGSFEGNTATDERGHESDVLDFYTTADGPEHLDGNGDVKSVELAVEASGNDHVLVRRVIRNLMAENPPNADEEVICRGVSAFRLEYFDGTEWQPSWDSTEITDQTSSTTGTTGTTGTSATSSSSTSNAGSTQSGPLPSAVRVTLELERPQADGQVRTFRFVRCFQLSCTTTIPGQSNTSTGQGF
jgi:prepilin-type N-terminal cleavage/methylation domain-containing protein